MESLPLFADLPELPEKRESNHGLQRHGLQQKAAQPERHLAAAARLAKAMRRLPDHSVEQTRVGQAICRHLIALLEESDR